MLAESDELQYLLPYDRTRRCASPEFSALKSIRFLFVCSVYVRPSFPIRFGALQFVSIGRRVHNKSIWASNSQLLCWIYRITMSIGLDVGVMWRLSEDLAARRFVRRSTTTMSSMIYNGITKTMATLLPGILDYALTTWQLWCLIDLVVCRECS